MQEAIENLMKQIEKQRISDFKIAGQPKADKTAHKEIKEKDNLIDGPIVVGMPKQSPDGNENIANTKVGTLPHFPLRLDVNTPFIHQDINHSARTTGPPEHHYSSQICRIQEENAGIQKMQVELLRRLTVPVPKPPVFNGKILEYPKWENTFDALIEDQVVHPNYKLYYLGEYTCGAPQKMISHLLGLQTKDPCVTH